MADVNDELKGKRTLAQEIATRASDPYFYGALNYLPNPDRILRKLGCDQEVYDDIISDAHVIGELRAVRSGLLKYEWRIQAGGEAPADLAALELAERFFARAPYPSMTWSDLLWTVGQAVFRGFVVHEVVWERQDRLLVPSRVIDRPQRRFLFGADNTLRMKTRGALLEGVSVEDRKFLVTRHMTDYSNPYGVALLSSCFWPYTFKHSGFKYFVKFCEKYGIPWVIGKYPPGTPKADQDALADSLAAMVEDAIAAIPNDAVVDLLESKSSGDLVHSKLIDLCNREMSKALTSQTLATEVQDKGARAVSETHREREQSVHESDREMIAYTFDTLLAWMTEINFAGATAPRFEFVDEPEVRSDWAELIDTARGFLQVPRTFAHEKLGIPLPTSGEDVLPAPVAPPGGQPGGVTFSHCPACGGHTFARGEGAGNEAQDALDRAIDGVSDADLQGQVEAMLEPVFAAIRSDGPEAALARLAELYPQMDYAALQERLARMIFVSEVWGRLNAGSD